MSSGSRMDAIMKEYGFYNFAKYKKETALVRNLFWLGFNRPEFKGVGEVEGDTRVSNNWLVNALFYAFGIILLFSAFLAFVVAPIVLLILWLLVG